MSFNSASVWATWLAPQARFDFSFPERLMVGSMRLWLSGETGWRIAAAEIVRTFGVAQGEAVAANMAAMFEALDQGARRDFLIFPPACDKVSTDERALVVALAAYQRNLTNWADAVVNWLVRASWHDVAAGRCRATAQLCEDHGLTFNIRHSRARATRAANGQIRRVAV